MLNLTYDRILLHLIKIRLLLLKVSYETEMNELLFTF